MNVDKDFFEMLKNLLKGNKISYVSTPINTGEKFIKWYNTEGKLLEKNSEEYLREKQKNVVDVNGLITKKYIEQLRKSTNKVIIDPTMFENKSLNWNQDDFYNFWSNIIDKLIDEIIFMDGWKILHFTW